MISYEGTALITGASSGIGEAFARDLASRGMDVVLVARSLDALEALAAELTSKFEIKAVVIRSDLGREGGAEAVFRETEARGIAITMLINNAGFATYGPFQTLALEREQEEVMVNVHSVVTLTNLYLPRLIETPGAAIINVASTAAFQPLPFMAVYGASKAFVLSFSEALWAQLKDTGVSVLAFCPGPVATRFASVVGAREAMVGKPDTPEFVVRSALRALDARRSFVVPRFRQLLVASVARLLPRAAVARTTAKVLRPRGLALARPPQPDEKARESR
jgi:hypothetical protein